MKSSRPLFYQCRAIFPVVAILFAVSIVHCFTVSVACAEDDDGSAIEEVANPSGKVEVQYEAEALAPYRQRRSAWSPIFGVNVSMLQPDKYYSQIDGTSYSTMFGSGQIALTQVQLGVQYNFSLGSFGIAIEGGYGKLASDQTGQDRSIQLTKKAATFTYTMNSIWSEPYVAPYISGEVLNFDYKEENPTISQSGSTATSTALTVGLLIQLNKLDEDSALDARNSSGLNNLFLDLFASQYNTSNSSSDVDFQSALNWGAGLKFEF